MNLRVGKNDEGEERGENKGWKEREKKRRKAEGRR